MRDTTTATRGAQRAPARMRGHAGGKTTPPRATHHGSDVSKIEFALFFHLLGAFLFVSGTVLAGVAFEAARRCCDPPEIALLLGLTRAGVLLVLLGATLVLALGLWLVHLEHVGYGAGWIDAALALYAAALLLGGVGGQRPKQARKLATRLSSEGRPATGELHALLDDRLSMAANYASAAAILAILALMVFKP
jgi:uncharacterized membrane protein